MSGSKPLHPDLRRISIINQAEKLLEDEGLLSLPVDLEAIASSREISLEAKPNTVAGVSGMLLRHGDAFGIIYATHIPSIGYQRFSIAHELGHYFLDGHSQILLPDSNSFHVSRAGFVSDDLIEREADYFASGLLMPTDLFRQIQRRRDDGLDAIIELADLCLSSLPATAIRYADLSDGAVVVIVSKESKVEYAFHSEGIKTLEDVRWVRKGSDLPRGSLTSRFNADPGLVLRSARRDDGIDISLWLSGRSVAGREEVIGLGAYERTLTVLTCAARDSTYGDDDEEDDESVMERWTPRFSKR